MMSSLYARLPEGVRPKGCDGNPSDAAGFLKGRCLLCSAPMMLLLLAQDIPPITRWLEDESPLLPSDLPHWTPLRRDMLMTGFCPRCLRLLDRRETT